VLNLVRLSGALMFLVDASDPWCVDIPHTDRYRSILAAPSQHLISYHVVLKGNGIATVPDEAPVTFGPGDIIVFPQGDGYRMESTAGTPPEFSAEETVAFFENLAAGRLPAIVPEGGGGDPRAMFLCGFLACDAKPFNPVLTKLPRLMVVNLPETGGDSLKKLIEVAHSEFQTNAAGSGSIRLHLCELIFIETLRRHVLATRDETDGWLAALSDPVAGPAISAIHADPAADWSLERLARQVSTSRSVLAERFAKKLGQGPMQYLTAWRMQLAARKLRDSRAGIANIAWSVGYRSEAAFSRAFKKATGRPPGAWRLEE
jgi:AraC-like DNA-binding protein